jgi:hypothetical protein
MKQNLDTLFEWRWALLPAKDRTPQGLLHGLTVEGMRGIPFTEDLDSSTYPLRAFRKLNTTARIAKTRKFCELRKKPVIDRFEYTTQYLDYKEGWLLGASGRHQSAAIGTPAPKFPEDWERGFEDGSRQFREAMKAEYDRLRNQQAKE